MFCLLVSVRGMPQSLQERMVCHKEKNNAVCRFLSAGGIVMLESGLDYFPRNISVGKWSE